MQRLRIALLSTAAAGLAFGLAMAPASAQMPDQKPPAASSQMQGGAQVKPDSGTGAQSGGQAEGRAGVQGDGEAQGEMQGQGSATMQRRQGEQESGGAAQREQGQREQGQEDSGSTAQRQQDRQKSGTTAQDRQEPGSTAQGKSGGKPDSRAGADSQAKVELQPQEKTEIKQYFTKNKTVIREAPKVEKSAVSVSIGVAVPQHVVLRPLPSVIVVDVPSNCPLMYFVWGTDVVIVDRCSRAVVEIIANVA